MNNLILIVMIVLLSAFPVFAQGQKVGLSWTEQYRWHGFEVFGDEYVHPGISTTVQGIDVSAVSHIGQAHDDIEYWDAIVGYKMPLGGLDVKVGYGYLIFPGVDIQELSATISLPGVISPRYTICHAIPDDGDSGQFHVIGVDIALGDPEVISAVLMGDITFNDFGPEIRDWSHATAGLAVNVPIGKLNFSPAVYYQHTIEPMVNDNVDEVWVAASLKYKF